MANVRPFKAVRPTRDKASLVASRSFLSYSDENLKEKLEHNPYTFLHIINPDYKNKIKSKGTEKYKLVKEKYKEFIDKKHLSQEKKPSYYIYQQQNTIHTFKGIIAATSVEDYINGKIKKHEHTITSREKMFKDYLETTGFNADPVLLSYPKNIVIDTLLLKYEKQRAEYEFTTTNKALHKLWVINDENAIRSITEEFNKIETLYIADGHHRCASSSLLTKTKKTEHTNYFMSFLIDENQLHIINFNRLIKGLNNLTEKAFLNKIKINFNLIENTKYNPSKQDEIGMYLKGKSYLLKAKKDSFLSDCVNRLDPAILSNNILKPILNIIDEKTDKNITFISGNLPLSELQKLVDSDEYQLAFILKPISINAIKEVADRNKFMPPKSTYIEPKLRSGLTIYPLD